MFSLHVVLKYLYTYTPLIAKTNTVECVGHGILKWSRSGIFTKCWGRNLLQSHHSGNRDGRRIGWRWNLEIQVMCWEPVHHIIRRGADKSLARLTSRYLRTESIVSLERGFCSCAELQDFSCYRGWKVTCKATRTISTTSRRELSSSFFYCKVRQQRKFTPFWQKH
jgi:hypothetical protein